MFDNSVNKTFTVTADAKLKTYTLENRNTQRFTREKSLTDVQFVAGK